MSKQGYRQIFKFDDPNLKELNDMLRWLYSKVTGRVEMRDLSTETKSTIDSKADGAVVDEIKDTADQAKKDSAQAKQDAEAAAGAVIEMQDDVEQAKKDSAQAKADSSEALSKADDASQKVVSMQTSIEQNEEAIRLKADKTVVDELSGTVSEHSAQFEVTAEQISSTVTRVDTLEGSVSTHETRITQTAEKVESTAKAVETLDGTVSDHETRITQTAEKIETKADKTVVDELGNVVSENSTAIVQTAEKIEATATRVQTLDDRVTENESKISQTPDEIRLAVQSVQIGGTNRLKHSMELRTTYEGAAAAELWRINRTDIVSTYEGADGFYRARFYTAGQTTDTWAGIYSPVTRLPYGWQDRQITLSAWVYSENWAGMDAGGYTPVSWALCLTQGELTRLNWGAKGLVKAGKVELADGVSSDTKFENGKWVRVSMTWTLNEEEISDGTGDFAANTHVFVQFFLRRNGAYLIYGPQLEFGNKATEWSPAPEDAELEIEKLSSELSVQAGKISANTEKIETVKGTADKAATDLTAVTKRVTTAETTISAVDAEVKTKVSQTDFNALGERVSSAEGSITTQAGRITANTTAIQTAQSTANSAQTQANENKTNLGSVTTRVTTAEQTISALDGKIATKVEKTTYEGLAGDVGDLEKVVESHSTLIEQTANDVLIQAGRTVGGTNYLRDSAEGLTGSAYFMGNYYFSDGLKPKAGENVTIRIWGSLGSDRTAFGIWNTNGYISIGSLTNNGDGTYSGTFEWKVDSASYPEYSVTEETQKGIQVYALPRTGTTASTIKKIKLERGDYATDWTPHPEDPSAGVNTGENSSVRVKITPDYFNVDVPGEDGDFILNEAGGQLPVLVGRDISAPNIAPRYDGPAVLYVNPNATSSQIAAGNYFRSLVDACAKLNNKWVGKTVTINLAAGMTEYGTVTLQGVSGGYWVQIAGSSASRAKLVGRMNLYFNASPVSIAYMNIDSDGTAVNIEGCQTASISHGVFTGPGTGVSGTRGVRSARGSQVVAGECEIYDFERSVYGEMGGSVSGYSCKGNCRVGVNRTTIYLSGTMPCDSTTWAESIWAGQVITQGITVDQGSKPTPETTPTTTAFSYLYSDGYAGKWGVPGTDAAQGIIQTDDSGNTAAIYGVIWFDRAAIQSAIGTRTVKQVSLRLHMQSGYGRGTAVSVQLYGTNTAYSGRSGQPALTTSYGTIGTTNPGEINEITIPAAVINDMVSGAIQALVLKSDDTELYKSREYSKNYARFSGTGSATAENCPRLTVVYQ